MLTQKWHWIVRGGVGGAALALGLVGLLVVAGLPRLSRGWDPALLWSITVFGAFTVGHLAISVLWNRVTTEKVQLMVNPSSLVQLAGALIAAPGVIVGLVAAFVYPLPLAVKTGVVSLALCVLAGFALFGTLVAETPQPVYDDTFLGEIPSDAFLVQPKSRQGNPDAQADTPSPGEAPHAPTAPRSIPVTPVLDMSTLDWQRMSYFRAYLFDLTLWLFAFGLLCVTFGPVFAK